jgi:transcription-repair coupling factor (superfamily II helicase)
MDTILESLKAKRTTTVFGLQGSAAAYILSELKRRMTECFVVLVSDGQRAEEWARDLGFFLSAETEIAVLPAWEVLPFDEASPYIRLQSRRIDLLLRLSVNAGPQVLVVPLGAWITRVPPKEWLGKQGFIVIEGLEISMEDTVRFLEDRGYRRVPLVEELGDYSVRGGILDCFPPREEMPIRIEFLGNQVESVRYFSPDTQRSICRIDGVELLPVREIPWSAGERQCVLDRMTGRHTNLAMPGFTAVLDNLAEGIPFPGMEFLLPYFHDRLNTLVDYLPSEALVVLDDPAHLGTLWRNEWDRAHGRARNPEIPLGQLVAPEELYLEPLPEQPGALSSHRRLLLKGLHIEAAEETAGGVVEVSTHHVGGLRSELVRRSHDEGEALTRLPLKLKQWLEDGLHVHWVLAARAQAGRICKYLEDEGVICTLREEPSAEGAARFRPRVWVHVGELTQGFMSTQLGVVFLTEEEVFGPRRLRKPKQGLRKLPTISHLEELQEGDLVVHVDHGIGIYRGLMTLQTGQVEGDFLLLEYLGNDRLYVPVSRMQGVHKYLGTEGMLPRIDRLGGGGWEKRKNKAKRAVLRMAKELLQLYASREVTPGFAFNAAEEVYREFEAAFPYEETADQRRAIDEVLADMAQPRPMDRLVCGDVGFGKTEVAMRAAFVAVANGKQVAYLVPTTILAEQHYGTFVERFRGYPVFIDVLSRFRTPREQQGILRRCEAGQLDILIGTHRLLQKDVRFKDLGLLIIDEEHRFGVAHKERLKKIRQEVDVLTLTATPIPRTLHMGMLGIRDLSVIETPPPERLSIRTVVAPFEQELVCEAVQRETARGGQVFFVHNRVQGIERIAGMLHEWLPDLRIEVAHGQMPARALAEVMDRYHRKGVDILVSTTIIQSGLDIPSANTILIHNAHHLGLAEMYQIRGRVGRAGHQAYAYLLVPGGERQLTRDALRRLRTLQEFSELGAGFRIATRDLEIRGAGTLLGPSQSGQIDAVGFELYTQMMRRAIAELKGEPVAAEIEPEIRLPVHAYLSEDYIPDAHQRLALYRRLSRAESDEMIDPLREEMKDRFGPIPDEGENLLQLMSLRGLLKAYGIKDLRLLDGHLHIAFHPSTPILPQALIQLVQSHADAGLRFVSEDTLVVPMNGEILDPLPLVVRKRLKRLLEGASMHG